MEATLTIVVTEMPIVTDKEPKIMQSKICLIDHVLKLIGPMKLAALRESRSGFPKFLVNLELLKVKTGKSHLSVAAGILNKVNDVLLKSTLLKLKEGDGISGSLTACNFSLQDYNTSVVTATCYPNMNAFSCMHL